MEKKEDIAFNIKNTCKGIQALKVLIGHVEPNWCHGVIPSGRQVPHHHSFTFLWWDVAETWKSESENTHGLE